MSVVCRFAPSPTGLLHLGNARTALLAWLFARQSVGRFILRIDDTDRVRSRPEYALAIEEDLSWLGLSWDERLAQSERTALYHEAFQWLRSQDRVYPCYETSEELSAMRAEQRKMGLPPRYRRAEARLAQQAGRAPYWRFEMPAEETGFDDLIAGPIHVPAGSQSDPVVRREDGSFSYLFSSVADDIACGITHILRGEDHISNTPTQIRLMQALGAAPPAFAHLPLVKDKDGAPLSKRDESLSLWALRESGIEPEAVVAVLAALGTGEPPKPELSLDVRLRAFDLGHYGRAAPTLEPDVLTRVNAHLLHGLAWSEACRRLARRGLYDPGATAWAVLRDNIATLDELEDWRPVLEGSLVPVIEDPELLERAAALLSDDLADERAVQSWLERLRKESGRKGRSLYHPLRLAITGRGDGPALKHLLALIGRRRVLSRLRGETA